MNMTKKQAVEIFGTRVELARSLGITKSAISQWAEDLDRRYTAMVIGAAVQTGKKVPAEFLPKAKVVKPAKEPVAA